MKLRLIKPASVAELVFDLSQIPRGASWIMGTVAYAHFRVPRVSIKVGRHHAAFAREGEAFTIESLRCGVPLLLNGYDVDYLPQRLSVGDRIDVGPDMAFEVF